MKRLTRIGIVLLVLGGCSASARDIGYSLSRAYPTGIGLTSGSMDFRP